MTSIIYIGMDVHTTNYTLCCYTADSDDAFAFVNVKPDYHEILKYMDRVRSTRGRDCRFICGYEAGCLGYSLYHQLARRGVECIILAPSTMPQQKGKSIKTNKRDAKNIPTAIWCGYSTRRPEDSVKTAIGQLRCFPSLLPQRVVPKL